MIIIYLIIMRDCKDVYSYLYYICSVVKQLTADILFFVIIYNSHQGFSWCE